VRTLVDILRKGNQELFHTSIISWLLDPKAEHGFGTTYLNELAELLSKKGDKSLKEELDKGIPVVRSEATSYKKRYDIEIQTNKSTFVFESKNLTKQELAFSNMATVLKAFMERFGLFEIS
jgi:hypothetical protein